MMWIPFWEVLLVSILLFASPAHNIFASFFWAWLPVWWPWVRWDSLWFEHKQWLCWAQALYSPEEQIQLFFGSLNHANSTVNKHARVSLRLSLSPGTSVFLWGLQFFIKSGFFCVFVLLQIFMILNSVLHFYIDKTLKIFKPKFQPFKRKHTELDRSSNVINIVYKVCFVFLHVT